MTLVWLSQWIEAIPTLAFARLTRQLAEARHAPHFARDRKFVTQQLTRSQYLAQDRTGAKQSHLRRLRIATDHEAIHAANDALGRTGRQVRLRVVLVHHREVIELVAVLLKHSPRAVIEDHGQLARKSGVVGAAVRNRRRDQMT